MRPATLRPALPASLLLLLSGCAGSGFGSFVNNTFSMRGDHYRPQQASENLSRANGKTPTVAPIATQSGDVWPGAIKPLPSLAEIAKTLPQAGTAPNLPPLPAGPALPRTPPPSLQTPETQPASPPAASSRYQPSVPTGTVVSTSKGQEKVSGGTGNFLTLTGPGGQYGGIMVPNGNGTSTIIRPGGAVETVPTPH